MIIEFNVLKMDFKDLEEKGYSSVTDYCRMLVKDKKKPLPDRIEVYRDEKLCLSVNDVRLAAELEPTGSGWRKHASRRLPKGRGEV